MFALLVKETSEKYFAAERKQRRGEGVWWKWVILRELCWSLRAHCGLLSPLPFIIERMLGDYARSCSSGAGVHACKSVNIACAAWGGQGCLLPWLRWQPSVWWSLALERGSESWRWEFGLDRAALQQSTSSTRLMTVHKHMVTLMEKTCLAYAPLLTQAGKYRISLEAQKCHLNQRWSDRRFSVTFWKTKEHNELLPPLQSKI